MKQTSSRLPEPGEKRTRRAACTTCACCRRGARFATSWCTVVMGWLHGMDWSYDSAAARRSFLVVVWVDDLEFQLRHPRSHRVVRVCVYEVGEACERARPSV